MPDLFRLLFLILLTLVFAGAVQGQVVRHGNCSVDAEIWSLPQCALEAKDGHLYVGKPYLSLFFPAEKSRLAGRMIPGGGWAYFNKLGLIVVRNVANFDNGPSPFHHGLVRVVEKNKWGLADSNGQLIVPLKYDGMLEFEEANRGWRVCAGCRTVSSGEYGWFEGGDWIWLDRHGNVVSKAEAPIAPGKSPGK